MDFIFVPLRDVDGKKRKQIEIKLTTQPEGSNDDLLLLPGPRDVIPIVPTQESFDGLVVKGKLGAGASATVLAATWHGEAVALKRGDPEEVAMEAQILARLSHLSVVEMRCLVQTVHMTAIMLERLEPFDAVLAHRGDLNICELEHALMQLVGALQHLPKHGIIHRDIKPQNILRGPESQCKLADFGDAIALPIPVDSAICLAGSPKYGRAPRCVCVRAYILRLRAAA